LATRLAEPLKGAPGSTQAIRFGESGRQSNLKELRNHK
jgi:hypothetical protein